MQDADLDTMAPILIHVGLHKCASTWLQNTLFSRDDLGFVAPWGTMSHSAVTEFVTVDPLDFDPGTAARNLRNAADAKTIEHGRGIRILSHEALSSRPHHGQYYAPTVAERLHRVFPTAKILLVFREQSSIIQSLYGEHVRNGGRNRLTEFVGNGKEPPGWSPLCRLPFFRYDRLIAMYAELFGAENVLALPMEMLRADSETFMSRIFRFAGLPPAAVETDRVANRGWSVLTIEAVRRSNGIVRKNPLGDSSGRLYAARQFIASRADRVIPAKLQAAWGASQKEAIRDRIAGYFQESNLRVSQMTGFDLQALGYDCGIDPTKSVNSSDVTALSHT